jgi:hypothetical protein
VRSDESSEIEVDKTAPEDYDMKQTNDEFDSTINSEISELTSDAYDGWMGSDTKWRRSPEGGEDVSVVSQTLDYSNSTAYDDSTSVTSSNVHMELLSSKHSPVSANGSVHSDSEETHASGSVKKEKKKKDKEKVSASERAYGGFYLFCRDRPRRSTSTKNQKRRSRTRRSTKSRVRETGGTRGGRGTRRRREETN